ncbi:MAG: hypothetical protein ACPHGV_06720 [Synechococcus sp.]
MTTRNAAPHREWRTPRPHTQHQQLTGTESAQRRRYLRSLAEDDGNDADA